ncbi:hypothetical protein NEDG_01907 [Nematocida displodere]|uniref:Trafficking protein particle complex subunit n=1 Tax=Nematocida displodere TaxID=1805483 RepID=A0A177EGP2_9MICR|nr:hypothetical protein NEDG_01907 [Nematocida displodere]
MIKGLLIVGSSGGLVFQKVFTDRITASSEYLMDVDKIIALSSTIYTAIEILVELGVCTMEGRYRRVTFAHEHASITALRTATRLIFIVIHSPGMETRSVAQWVDRVYGVYVDTILYDPMYTVGGRIASNAFNDVF